MVTSSCSQPMQNNTIIRVKLERSRRSSGRNLYSFTPVFTFSADLFFRGRTIIFPEKYCFPERLPQNIEHPSHPPRMSSPIFRVPGKRIQIFSINQCLQSICQAYTLLLRALMYTSNLTPLSLSPSALRIGNTTPAQLYSLKNNK